MKKQNIKYTMVLALGLSIMGIQATPKTYEQYRQEAMGLRDVIFDKYKQGTLSSRVPFAKVDSVSVDVLNPDMAMPEKDYSELDHASFLNDIKYAQWKKNIAQYGQKWSIWHRAQGLTQGVIANHDYEDAHSSIALSGNEVPKTMQYRKQCMFHEMAHALDGCLRKPENEHGDCYTWLHGDIKNHPDRQNIDLREWHAEKQSIEWMKELNPDDAKALKKEFKQYVAGGAVRSNVPKYPPMPKLIEWLSTYNPLRMKEIKKLGLLWNM